MSWWTMQTADGRQGLVPVNYIDKLDLPPEKEVTVAESSSGQYSGNDEEPVMTSNHFIRHGDSFALVNSSASNRKSPESSSPDTVEVKDTVKLC